jgi:hypothetical protein
MTKESKLSKEQAQTLHQTLESKSTWFIKQHDTTAGIFSTNCECLVNVPPSEKSVCCSQCKLLKDNISLLKALNVEYATEDTIKYIPGTLMKQDMFQSKLIRYEELRHLNSLLEKHSRNGDGDFWKALAIQAKRGFFKEMDAFQGLVKAVAI